MFTLFPGLNLSLEGTLFDLIKILFLIGFFLYVAFAFIALRQMEIMRKTVETPLSAVVRILGLAHLIAAIIVFGLVFSILSV